MATVRGGDKLGEKLAEFAKRFSNAKSVRIGFLEGATYPDGTSVPMVAAIQEFGAPRAFIPPRPYFRNMIAARKGEWPQAMADLLKANNFDARATLEKTGEAVAAQLRQSIVDTLAPALSPVTLMLRKMFGNHPELIRGRDVTEARRRVRAGESTSGVSTKPLIWTGYLLNKINYQVKT